jgi:ribonuclease D
MSMASHRKHKPTLSVKFGLVFLSCLSCRQARGAPDSAQKPNVPLFFPFSLRSITRVIDCDEALEKFLPTLKAAPWVAIDTEADSLHAYPEKLCLLQISLPGHDELIDPLALADVAPLLRILRGKELILHGADYDLRLLYRTFQFVPQTIFDTMSAARLLGYAAFGLRDLVLQHLGTPLEKGPQKMNWAVRPLSPRMVAYALNDTRYLRPLAVALSSELQRLGRLSWQEEVCTRLIQECTRSRQPDPDQWRIKGSDRLDAKGLAVLRSLWRWREKEALAANKPPYFVMSHEKLVAIATATAQGRPLDHLLGPKEHGHRAAALAAAIAQVSRLTPEKYPQKRRSTGRHITREQQSRFEQFKQLRDQHARELAIDPTLIASRADLLLLARNGAGQPQSLMAWQRQLLGLPPA